MIENKDIKEEIIDENTEEVAETISSILDASGIDVTKMKGSNKKRKSGWDNIKPTTRTLEAPAPIVNELIENIFNRLDIKEENGLLEMLEQDNGNRVIKWESTNLSISNDPAIVKKETNIKNNIIESLLYYRNIDELLNGVTAYNSDEFLVYDNESDIIKRSFQIIVENDPKEVASGFKWLQSTLKWTTEMCNEKFFISHVPISLTSLDNLLVSILITDIPEETVIELNKALRNTKFEDNVSNYVHKAGTMLNVASKIAGTALKESAEHVGTAFGNITGSIIQSFATGMSEGANAFFDAFDAEAIVNRPSTIEACRKAKETYYVLTGKNNSNAGNRRIGKAARR